MSVKDVREYYDKISEDYHELVLTLKELEEEYNNNLVSPEALENLKKQIEPIKTNFRTISYITPKICSMWIKGSNGKAKLYKMLKNI